MVDRIRLDTLDALYFTFLRIKNNSIRILCGLEKSIASKNNSIKLPLNTGLVKCL
jgi:hypothetical protein